MKRVGIISVYNEIGVVEKYVYNLISSLKSVCSYTIVVVNGDINKIYELEIKQMVDEVVIRDNFGNDGGAYADVLVNYIGEEQIREYDEIVLVNDTFFGPFESFYYIFEKMEDKPADVWGLNYFDNGFWSFLESYFLVIRSKAIKAGDVFHFFKRLYRGITVDSNYSYLYFELGFSAYMEDRGYSLAVYKSTDNISIYKDADVCIMKYGLPILKKKCFKDNMCPFERLENAIYYVEKEYEYEVAMILDYASKYYSFFYDEKKVKAGKLLWTGKYAELYVPYTKLRRDQIIARIKESDSIYIYGTGTYAKVIYYLFEEYLDNFKGFVISKNENSKLLGRDVFCIDSIKSQNVLIILGMNLENTISVASSLGEEHRVLPLWDMSKYYEK